MNILAILLLFQLLPNSDAETLWNQTTISTIITTLSTTISPVSNATELPSNTTTTVSSLVNVTTTAVPNNDDQSTQKPHSDEETSRNSSSGSIQGRSMNFNAQENKSTDTQTSITPEKGSLQDLSLDDIDETSIVPTSMHEDKMNSTATVSPTLTSTNMTEQSIPKTTTSNTSDMMMVNGSSCVKGQTFERGCSEKCECGPDGKAICRPRCTMPFFRRGARINDPACIEKPSEDDPCCSMMVCTQDTETEPLEGCTFKNQSYQRGETINDGCVAVCTCGEAGQISCKSRCPPVANNSSPDRCLELSDPTDPCCKVVRCDVTLGDHDVSKIDVEEATPARSLQLLTLEILNKTSVRLALAGEHHENVTIESSLDQKTWTKQESQGLVVTGLENGRTYFLRAKSGNIISNVVEVSLPSVEAQPNGGGCMYKGQHYMPKEEFHDGCEAYCACTDSGVQCATIECPTEFGLDVLDPNCVDWETQPPDFKPTPPKCCPEQVRCRSNGSCIYEGEMFNNWAEIPLKLTGCSKRCYCEFGNVSCQSTCPPVTAAPPPDLQCGSQQPILSHLPGDECCLFWMCPQTTGNNVTMMHDRPTDQRQSENDTAKHGVSAVQQPGPSKSTDPPRQHHTFLPLNPDYVPPELVPLLEPLKSDVDNHTKSIKNEHPVKQKNPKDETKKSQAHGDHHHIEEITVSPFIHSYMPDTRETVQEHSPPPFNKSQNVSMLGGEHQPFNVKPPFLHEYEDEPIDDTNQPMWGLPHITGSKINEAENLPLPQDKLPSPGPPVHAPQDHRQQSVQNNLNPEDYYVNSNERPGTGPEEVYHIQAVPRPPDNQPQRPSVQHLDSSDPHLDQILKHLQNQGILPEHYTVLPEHYTVQHEGPPRQEVVPPHQLQLPQQNVKNRPDNRPPHEVIPEDYPIPPHPGRLPTPYHPSYVPKPIPRPGQQPILYQQNIVPQLHQNNPLPHHYTKQVGRQPDSDGPVIAHIPYQELLVPQYHGVSHIPSHVDIDHLLLTANGRQNHSQPDEITVNVLEPVDENTVKLVFSVPPVLVGLHGRVELRYTNDKENNEPSTWSQEVFAPHGDLIATPQLEFELGGLQPDTLYKIKIIVILRDLQNSPSSKILKIRTPPPAIPTTTLPPQIPVDVGLAVVEVNSTWAKLIWRKFNEFELQFIDGVQLRYKERDGKVYAATPLIHRAVTSYTLEDLRPYTEYEVGIFFIPFPGQTTELTSERIIHLTTADVHDLYKFNVTLDVHHIKSTSVELSWSGVPYPEDKYVNIFRAIYQSDAEKEDFSTFKVAKRDSQARTIVQDLKPGTRYRLWLEVYLTNGKIKKSNVQDFMTKPGAVPSIGATQQGKLKGEGPEPVVESTKYYGPLVAVAIIAALAIVAALILLLILMRKHGTNKAAISATRKTQSAYDNPSYKTSENDPAATANGGTGAKTVEQP